MCDFSDYPMDVNGDGKIDIITSSWWSNGIFWRENPGDNGEWKTHQIIECKSCETIRYFDIDGCGTDEVFSNNPGEPAFFLKLVKDGQGKGTGKFDKYVIGEQNAGHGLGFGDIDGDGKVEVILNSGILHMPEGGPCAGLWSFTEEYKMESGPSVPILAHDVNGDGLMDIIVGAGHGLGFGDIDGDGKVEVILNTGILHMPAGGPCAGLWSFTEEYKMESGPSVPILAHDVNGDGLMDIIVGAGHGYGLFWYEQGKDESGKRIWTRHVIDSAWSQYHDMQMADIDGDGELELVTGKRWRAHCGNDPGDNEAVFTCYYKIKDGRFYRHIIDYGNPEGGHSGVGIYFWLADLTGNGKLDIIAPGKEGLYVFFNE